MVLRFDEWDRDRYQDDQQFPQAPVIPPPRDPSEDGTWSNNPPGGTVPPPEEELVLPTFSWPSYSGPTKPNIKIGPAPKFNAPRFRQPSLADAQNEPGYQFRVGQGTEALERSAAARGVLRTGGTLKDLVEYGQNFAAEEYKNVFDRALQSYGTDYRAAYDEYAPAFSQWQAQAGADQSSALAGFERMWQQYMLQVQNAQYEDQVVRSLLPTEQPEPEFERLR